MYNQFFTDNFFQCTHSLDQILFQVQKEPHQSIVLD